MQPSVGFCFIIKTQCIRDWAGKSKVKDKQQQYEKKSETLEHLIYIQCMKALSQYAVHVYVYIFNVNVRLARLQLIWVVWYSAKWQNTDK